MPRQNFKMWTPFALWHEHKGPNSWGESIPSQAGPSQARHREKESRFRGKRYALRLWATISRKAPPTPSNAHVEGSGTKATGEKWMSSRRT